MKSDTERGKLMLLEITDHLDNTDGNCDLDVKGIRHWVKKLQTLLENMKEKTCTLTWRLDGSSLADCSNCGEGQLYNDYNYCPSCGARNITPGRDRVLVPAGHSDCEVCNPPAEEPSEYDEEHDPGLFAWECPECKAYGDSIEGPRTVVCPECGSNVIPNEDVGKKPEKKCKCYEGSILGPGRTECPYCGGELPGDFIPQGVVYVDTDSILMLFCNKCNKIIRDPVWDEETHSPYCPDCKTTLTEKSPDEEVRE